jgi:hypothetical protein
MPPVSANWRLLSRNSDTPMSEHETIFENYAGQMCSFLHADKLYRALPAAALDGTEAYHTIDLVRSRGPRPRKRYRGREDQACDPVAIQGRHFNQHGGRNRDDALEKRGSCHETRQEKSSTRPIKISQHGPDRRRCRARALRSSQFPRHRGAARGAARFTSQQHPIEEIRK